MWRAEGMCLTGLAGAPGEGFSQNPDVHPCPAHACHPNPPQPTWRLGPPPRCHRREVLSSEPEASRPPGVAAAAYTREEWPQSWDVQALASTSHTLRVVSWDAETA